MIENLDICFGRTGQKIYLDCPEGRPSSVTSVSVWEDGADDTTTVEAAVGAASIEDVDTVTDEAAGPSEADPTRVPLESTEDIIEGRQYPLVNAAGEVDWIDVERVVAGDAVYGRTPLAHDHATGSSFGSPRVEATVDATWVADVSNLSDPERTVPRYRHVWIYEVAGVEYRTPGYFDLTRYPYACSVTPQDLDAAARGTIDRLPVNERRGQGRALLREASRQVRMDLFRRRCVDYAQRNSEILNELVRRKALFVIAEMAQRMAGDGFAAVGGMNASVAYEERRYVGFLDGVVAEMQQQVTSGGAGAPRRNVGKYWSR